MNALFEVSWEVCNKVGGIYTVIVSKVNRVIEALDGKSYYLIGPYFKDKARGEFDFLPTPKKFKKIFAELEKEGIKAFYGRWLISNKPETILIDFKDIMEKADEIKLNLWKRYKIDSWGSGVDFNEPVVWSYAVGRLMALYYKLNPHEKAVAQFHEWLSGTALLHLKSNNVKIGTIFTTHATMLGRTLAGSNINLYSNLDKINADQEAKRLGVQNKHLTEKACASHADVFTTVSEITGREATAFFGRAPDVYLLNGLDIGKFPTIEENSIRHNLYRNKIREFLMAYFFPYYSFDINEALTFFICGRREYHVKGIDLFIEALANLNNKLKETDTKRTVVAFFFIPGDVRNIKHSLLENKSYLHDLKDSIKDHLDDVEMNIINALISRKHINEESLFSKELISEIDKKVKRFFIGEGEPPLSTHDIYNEQNDEIISNLKRVGLTNKKEDRVKVIYYPIFLTGADGLLDTDYYETISGNHLGVFPSYYEPWGYTPLESAALGVPAITTDLAGFGRYIASKLNIKDNNAGKGIFVIKRDTNEWADIVKQLTEVLFYYATLPRSLRVENKIEARELAGKADWKEFIANYKKAYELAEKAMGPL
jgi:glycogen(starch) synthase